MKPLLAVSDLRVAFGDKEVVHGISFQIAQGEKLALVGESGSGKTISALALLRLVEGGQIAGSVHLSDPQPSTSARSLLSLQEREMRAIRGQDIAMIFQEPMTSLNPVFTVGEQIAESVRTHQGKDRAAASAEALRMLELVRIPEARNVLGRYPHQLSGGMRQRVMIAMALCGNPRLILADEPTTALDVTIQAQILELMKRVQQQHGTSVILITHNMGIVAEACDDVAVMYMGRVVEYGTLEQVFNHPLHPYTCALMRSVPVLGIGKDKKLESIKGSTPDASIEFTHCEFAERCDHCTQRCLEGLPQDRILPDGHRVRCFRYAGEGEAND